jgi:hypothetical protein
MTAEAKLRTLAQQDAVLQTYFFTNGQVRWFDRQLQPNYLLVGRSCVRVLRISTSRLYSHETADQRSQNRMAFVRFQIDVLDFDAERCRSAADAVLDWLATIDLSSNAQFGSPVTSPTRHPNAVLNQRAGMDYKLQPPAYVEMLDVRILNLEE